jgi:hypothetical protein
MAACAYSLTLGKKHFRYAPSAYRVCITETQAKKLFGSTEKPKPLGCGVFACAFQHSDPNKIVKITRDPSDVAGIMKGQGAQVPKLHAVHRLTSGVRWINPRRRTEDYQQWPEQPEAFAMVLEKLRTLTGAEKSMWQQRIRRMQRFVEREKFKQEAAAGHPSTAPGSPSTPPRPSYQPPTLRDMAKAVCPRRPADEAASCSLRIRELDKISVDLRARGVEWSDIHAGNIGFDKKGRMKALDVGASTTPLEEDLPELAGRRRR